MAKDKSESVFDVGKIREFIELMQEHDLNEVDLKHADQRIRLRRGPEGGVVYQQPVAAAPMAAAPAAGVAAGATAGAAAEEAGNFEYINCPTLGTFYSKPKPDTADFVKVGDMVTEDTVVCIVEAMKMFNEITAGVSGKIVQCMVKNEDAVDVNKPLFKISVD